LPKKNSGKGEKFLIERIREGEEHAFEIAFLKYFNPLTKYIWKFVRSEDLAKEIVQEVFTEIWECRRSLKPSGHLRGYLFEVARNKALDYIKHKKIVDQYISESKRQKRDNLNKKAYSYDADYSGLIKEADKAINDLPPKARKIYKLNRNEGLTYKEISEYLDISIKTVETHMRRVLKKLRNRLSHFVPLYLLLTGMFFISFF